MKSSSVASRRRMLERYGDRVMLAHDGAQAVALYAQHRDEIAVVLTDIPTQPSGLRKRSDHAAVIRLGFDGLLLWSRLEW